MRRALVVALAAALGAALAPPAAALERETIELRTRYLGAENVDHARARCGAIA